MTGRLARAAGAPVPMYFEWFVCLRYLRAKQRHGFLSLITVISMGGVLVGVMALIIVLAVMTGFSQGLRDKILGINSHIVLRTVDGQIDDYRPLAERLAGMEGVVGVSPYVYAQTMISAGDGGTGAILRGIDPATIDQVLDLDRYMFVGDPRQLETGDHRTPPIILGRDLARQLQVGRGDAVRLILADGPLTPIGIIPRVQTCRVVGIFESGMYEYDSVFAFVSLQTAQQFLDLGDAVHGLEVRVADIDQAGVIARRIERELGLRYLARDWISANKNLFSALKLEKTALSIIVALIVIVAAFNIVSTLIMLVMEKHRDIAILKSMGAPAGAIMRIFIFEGLVIGLTGTVLGVAGGLTACHLLGKYRFIKLPDVYPLSTLPVQVVPADVIIIAGAAILISLLATIYPAWQAARVEPARTLRYE